jgi:hypothetical protein
MKSIFGKIWDCRSTRHADCFNFVIGNLPLPNDFLPLRHAAPTRVSLSRETVWREASDYDERVLVRHRVTALRPIKEAIHSPEL